MHAPAEQANIAALETALLLEAVFQRFGHDYRAHDQATIARKLRVLMEARALGTVSALQEQVLHSDGVAQQLLRALAVEPEGPFDDPAFVRELRSVLAASLHASPLPKIWLAECGAATEAWALAIVLAEQQLDARAEIYATVADEARLLEMREATVPEHAVVQWHHLYRQGGGSGNLAEFFEFADGRARLRAQLRAQLRARIVWFHYSLVTDASFNEFQAIVCSSILPTLGPAMRQRALGLFHDSLARFGVLAIDGQLLPGDAHAHCYQAIGAQRNWYKRVA
ncbi:CheR family methyltransferase [Massilia sp. S19_KUP03_FR1]|uniref:CheR family methyltransferase n=1 Tax=Massilia sp. S19_KUP03_FR1 TaxID=3025503 RepID=UPI002FCDB191